MTNQDRPWIKSYDEWVEPDLTVPDVTYVELVEEGIRQFPDRPAFRFMGTTLRFRDLDDYSRRFAHFLAEAGCRQGDVVGINLPNSPQYLLAHAGVLRAGCITTGVSPLLSAKEIAHQLRDSGARVLVTLDAIFEHRFMKIQDQVPELSHVVVTSIADFFPGLKRILGKALKKIPTGKVVPVPGKTVLRFMDVLRTHPPEGPEVSISPDDVCLIQYTGGTTGLPKGAELTHRNMVSNVHQLTNWVNAELGTGVFCSGAPFFHVAGLMVGMLSMAAGWTQVLIPDPRNTRHICKEIARYRPTHLFNVPSLYQLLLANPKFKTLDFSQVKMCCSGAAPFSAEPFRALEAVVGEGKVIEIYGLTETSPILTMNPLAGPIKLGSIGLPMPNTRIKLADLETGSTEVALGEEGEIIAQGPQVMKGYHNKPEETAHAIREFQGQRWFFTGDIAKMDEDGYVFIVDRAKDMIIVGGFKVFSKEAEETLYDHPCVEYCAFIGVPNPERPGSELVKAVIQVKPEYKDRDPKGLEQDIIAYCKENMAPYKVPKIIQFVDEMPLTAVGKVDKKALR